MTVQELIQELKRYPRDAQVYVYDRENHSVGVVVELDVADSPEEEVYINADFDS